MELVVRREGSSALVADVATSVSLFLLSLLPHTLSLPNQILSTHPGSASLLWEEHRTWTQKTWIDVHSLFIISCVTSYKTFTFSELISSTVHLEQKSLRYIFKGQDENEISSTNSYLL